MNNGTYVGELQKISMRIERLKSVHSECLRTLEGIQGEIRANIRNATANKESILPIGPGYELFGHWFPESTGNDILVGVLQQFSELDSEFPERFARRLESVGRSRIYISKDKSALYPGRPDLAQYNRQFAPEWYVGTNESNERKSHLLQIACEVLGLEYGVDVRVRMPC